MARNGFDSGRGSKWCSYKRISVVVCCVNLVAALLLLRSFYSSFLGSSSTSSNPFSADGHSEDQIKRVEESIRVRKELEPTKLTRFAKEFKEDLSREEKRRVKLLQPMKQKLISEVLQGLKGLQDNASVAEQREAVESWRAKKLEEVKSVRHAKSTANLTISDREAKMLERALNSSWLMVMQDIGLWIAADVPNTEISDKSENEQELDEEEIIAGRPLPPECHAELHTDYDGAAVKWGLTHHKESAADCCQACLDHAKHAKPGELKCNIWVYCPSEFGCYSPDIYEHKHQECWLKQADKPRLNYKDKYSESYRTAHPTAPVVVPWISGVVGS